MTRFVLRVSILLLALSVLPLPWIVRDPGLLTVDVIGLGASVCLLLLALARLYLTKRGAC